MKKCILIGALAALMLFAFTACDNTTAVDGAVQSVEATQAVVYVEGETPTAEGFTYTGYTNMGATVTVEASDITLVPTSAGSGVSANTYGIVFKGQPVGTVVVDFEAVESIEVDASKATTEYYKIPSDVTGVSARELVKDVIVTAKYDGGSKVVSNNDLEFDTGAVTWNTVGSYDVTVSLGAEEDTYEIEVVENLVKSVAAKVTDGYSVYYTGDAPSGNPAYVDGTTVKEGIYVEKTYQSEETVMVPASAVKYQLPATGAYDQTTFPAVLIPKTPTSVTVNMAYTGTDGIVGLNKTTAVSVSWTKNVIASVEIATTPSTVSKASGFGTDGTTISGFTASGKMTNGTAATIGTINYWDGKDTAPETGNYLTVNADLSSASYVVGDRYTFTVTGKIEGFNVSKTFEAVIAN